MRELFQTLFDNRHPAVATVFDLRMAILGAPFVIACRDVPLSNNMTGGDVISKGRRGLFVWIAITSRTGDGRIQERFLNFGAACDQNGIS